jgi:hypothetical protein
LLLNHFFGFTGPFGFDDIEYAHLGYLIFEGKPDWTNPFIFRFGIVIPNGISQFLFGINEHIAAIYPLAVSLGIIIIVMRHVATDWKSKFIAGALLFASPWIVFYSDKIGADIPVAFFILLSVSILYCYRFNLDNQKKGYLYGLFFASSLFLGLITKETIWFLFPLVTIFFFRDVLQKQYYKFWIGTICSLVLFMFAYLLWQKVAFNDWFYRFNLIKANSYQSICNYDKQPFLVVFNRITYELWLYLLRESSFIIPIVFLLATINKRFLTAVFSKQSFWVLTALILILSANFWTISYNSYHPLCVDIRHYLYIFPVAAIAIANNYQELTKNRPVILVTIVCALVILFSAQLGITSETVFNAAIIGGIFLLMLVFRNQRKQLLLLLILVPLVNLFHQIKAATDYNYYQQKETAENFLKDKHDVTIYTSEAQKRLFNYYLGFENKNRLSIAPYHFFSKLESGYHYWNYHVLQQTNEFNSIPAEIEAVSIAKNSVCNSNIIKIYKWDEVNFSSKEFNLWSSDLWQKNDANLKPYEINASDEYGPTFKMRLDSTIKNIYISSTWWLKNETLSDASLIFSVEENGKNLFYKGYSIKTDKAAVSSSYKLFKSVNIESLDIRDSAELKVYIWNNFRTKLDIKDAKVNLVLNH